MPIPIPRRKPKRTAPPPRVNTAIGEIGVHVDDRDYVLRPSLYAMSQLGDPSDTVRALAQVHGPAETQAAERLRHMTAVSVLAACTREDIRHLTGYLDGDTYRAGRIPAETVLVLARELTRHGIVGALPPRQREEGEPEPEYTEEFDARGYASAAIAHLDASEEEAWAMTMTGLVGALRAKFPPPPKDPNRPGARAPTQKQAKAALDWHDKIRKMRSAKNG